MHLESGSFMRALAKPAIAGLLGTALAGCSGHPPAELGSAARGLAPCPASPNCVSSLADDPARRVAPLHLAAERQRAATVVAGTIEGWPRARVTAREPGYIRSEFTSRLLRFVDDVEFWWEDDRTIHIRSASRLGYSDFGVNRARVEALREEIEARLP